MESTPEEAAEGSAIVKVLAAVLERLVLSNKNLAVQDPGQVTKFHALKAPGIGVLPYLERIHKYASCSNECFILALIYIDRLIQRNNFLLTELNVHRVVITAILLAAKFFDDAYYNNAYYSKVGGVLVSEMNGLEVDFLFRINFSLHVPPELFEKYKAELVAHSISSGLSSIPQVPRAMETVGPSGIALPNIVQAQAMSGAMPPLHVAQSQLMTNQVAPSPSHATSRTAAGLAPGTAAIDPRIDQLHVTTTIPGGQVYGANQQVLQNGLTQEQMLHRSRSLPPLQTQTSRCLYSNPPYSAPMVAMLPVGVEEQYMMVGDRLFPIQTNLVHHHHGVDKYQEQAGFHPTQGTVGSAHPLANNSFGSLVAGHY